jgi:hypothetical protein
VRKALLGFGLNRVVVRGAGVVAIGSDVLEARIRLDELRGGYGLRVKRTRRGKLATELPGFGPVGEK